MDACLLHLFPDKLWLLLAKFLFLRYVQQRGNTLEAAEHQIFIKTMSTKVTKACCVLFGGIILCLAEIKEVSLKTIC